MLRNIIPSERKRIVEYEIEFLHPDTSGFAFPCDKDGKLLPDVTECARHNYEECMAHPEEWETWNHFHTIRRSYTEPAHGTCICGREVILYDQYYGACQCECGRWYNLFGQELLPPEQWEHDPSEDDYYDDYYAYDCGGEEIEEVD